MRRCCLCCIDAGTARILPPGSHSSSCSAACSSRALAASRGGVPTRSGLAGNKARTMRLEARWIFKFLRERQGLRGFRLGSLSGNRGRRSQRGRVCQLACELRLDRFKMGTWRWKPCRTVKQFRVRLPFQVPERASRHQIVAALILARGRKSDAGLFGQRKSTESQTYAAAIPPQLWTVF